MLYEVSSEVPSPGIELSTFGLRSRCLSHMTTGASDRESQRKRNIRYFHFLLRQQENHFALKTQSITLESR